MVNLNINTGQREYLLEILNYEYVIPEMFQTCVKDAIKKYATNTKYSDTTVDLMLKKPQSMAASIGAIQDNNLSFFRGKFAEWLACIEYNAIKNKGIVIMTIINPDLTSKADLLHIIKKGDKYEAIPGPDIKCGGSTYVFTQWKKIVTSRYDIPMVDMDGVLTTEEGLKMLTNKQREEFKQLEQLYPKKKPIRSEWNKQDVSRLMMDYLKYVSEGVTPADTDNTPFIANKENRDKVRDKLLKLPEKIDNQASWEVFCKKASELLNIQEDYLNPITIAKAEKKKQEEAAKKNYKASSENEKRANEKEHYDKTKRSENNNANKSKPKGFIKGIANFLANNSKGIANFLGFESPTDMLLDVSLNFVTALIDSIDEASTKNTFGRNSDSGSNLFDNQESEETYNVSNDTKNDTNENTKTNESTHASPGEHTVKGHGQHYNTKKGRVWKEKEPFSRGKKDDSI